MKITQSMVKKLRITDVDNLDPLTVIAENFGEGAGKIIIECYGESWSHFWSHMGKQYTLETFFVKASDYYLAGKLCHGNKDQPDWDGMPDHLRKEIVKMRRSGELSKSDARELFNDSSSIDHEVAAHLSGELMVTVLGDDWMCHIPDTPTREYRYLTKIIPVVKAAFTELLAASAIGDVK